MRASFRHNNVFGTTKLQRWGCSVILLLTQLFGSFFLFVFGSTALAAVLFGDTLRLPFQCTTPPSAHLAESHHITRDSRRLTRVVLF